MSYHVLKKRKKTPTTCSHALSPPLGIEETLLTEAFVLFFSSFPPSNPSSASIAVSIGSSVGSYTDSMGELNSRSFSSSKCEPLRVSWDAEAMTGGWRSFGETGGDKGRQEIRSGKRGGQEIPLHEQVRKREVRTKSSHRGELRRKWKHCV
jgi:hypothetical protein